MDIIGTNPIRRTVKINPEWSPTNSICEPKELSFSFTGPISFPQSNFGHDDSIIITCRTAPKMYEINVAELFASTSLYFWQQNRIYPYLQPTLINLFTEQYTEQSIQTIFIDQRQKKALLEQLWISAVNQIKKYYLFSNENKIQNFLKQHRYYVDVLNDMHMEINKIFGSHVTKLFLEHDQDIEEEYEGISVMIQTNLSVEDSLDLLNLFDEAYWLKKEFKVRRLMTVMVVPQ